MRREGFCEFLSNAGDEWGSPICDTPVTSASQPLPHRGLATPHDAGRRSGNEGPSSARIACRSRRSSFTGSSCAFRPGDHRPRRHDLAVVRQHRALLCRRQSAALRPRCAFQRLLLHLDPQLSCRPSLDARRIRGAWARRTVRKAIRYAFGMELIVPNASATDVPSIKAKLHHTTTTWPHPVATTTTTTPPHHHHHNHHHLLRHACTKSQLKQSPASRACVHTHTHTDTTHVSRD